LYHPSKGILRFGDVSGGKPVDSNFDIYDNYANTDNLAIMVADQISKFQELREESSFYLSYTLTQQVPDDIFFSVFGINTILELSAYANRHLWAVASGLLALAESTGRIPNFIAVDNVDCNNAISVAMLFNQYVLEMLENKSFK